MSDNSTPLSAKEQIDILLKEYDTLRQEIIARTSQGFQVLGFGVLLYTALVAWFGAHSVDRTFWVLLIIFVLTIAVVSLMAHRDINMAARRISEIELHVNNLAGATLLQWETKYGAAV